LWSLGSLPGSNLTSAFNTPDAARTPTMPSMSALGLPQERPATNIPIPSASLQPFYARSALRPQADPMGLQVQQPTVRSSTTPYPTPHPPAAQPPATQGILAWQPAIAAQRAHQADPSPSHADEAALTLAGLPCATASVDYAGCA